MQPPPTLFKRAWKETWGGREKTVVELQLHEHNNISSWRGTNVRSERDGRKEGMEQKIWLLSSSAAADFFFAHLVMTAGGENTYSQQQQYYADENRELV